ncbi:hypothetical protein [Actinomadura sp. NPDC048394]|uniref:hypothetical protein n=1 Tax=Actinomadura sp. NPDC048394 TaxID=3158223 RepID=UPI0033C30213
MDQHAADGSGIRTTRTMSSATKSRRPSIGERIGSVVKASLSLLIIGCFLTFSLLDIGSAWSAKLNRGTRGIFVAEECWRTNSGCHWIGNFVSYDGKVQRADVEFEGKVAHAGQQVPARDTGDRVDVYPMGGGWDWLWTTIILVLSLAALALWTLVWLVWPRRESHASRS